jgi:hypothetical protein
MAWGYWTCYNTSFAIQNRRHEVAAFSPPRDDRSRERSLERERSFVTASSSNSADSIQKSHGGQQKRGHPGGAAAADQHIYNPEQPENHVEPEKVAFERRLLLGDPDWGSRTIADRNTLPRKKQPEYDKNSTPEVFYGTTTATAPAHSSNRGVPVNTTTAGRRSSSKMAITPPDSLSRKSDENFCPACAQHNSSNRESRVSFGSLASSSRGSSNAPPGHHAGGVPIRIRSRSQDDDDCSSDARGALSTSLPTPPPPPFSSQRDLIRHQASLLETINQKMAFLSAFKLPPPHQGVLPPPPPMPAANTASLAAAVAAQRNMATKYNTIESSAYYFSNHNDQEAVAAARSRTQRGRDHEKRSARNNGSHHSRSSNAHRSRDKTTSREHSSSSLHSLGGGGGGQNGGGGHHQQIRTNSHRQRDCDTRPQRSSTSRRTSRSGSRTPKSSQGSRESMGSRDSRDRLVSNGNLSNNNSRGSKSVSVDFSEPSAESSHAAHPEHHAAIIDVLLVDEAAVEADEEDGDSDCNRKTTKPCKKPTLPPKPSALVIPPPSLGSFIDSISKQQSAEEADESETSLIMAFEPPPLRPFAAALGITTDEGSGTVRRRSRGQRSSSSRPHSTEVVTTTATSEQPPPLATSEVTIINSQRSSQSHTPDDDEEEDEDEMTESSPTQRRRPRRSKVSSEAAAAASTNYNPNMQHFKHFDHAGGKQQHRNDHHHPYAGEAGGLFTPSSTQFHHEVETSRRAFSPPSRGATFYSSRPRSASIGNRLSDAESAETEMERHHAHYHHHYRHRRHHTLDGHRHGGHHFGLPEEAPTNGGGQRVASMTSFHSTMASSRSISSKSGKSSSRSSQSPSVENIKHGMQHNIYIIYMHSSSRGPFLVFKFLPALVRTYNPGSEFCFVVGLTSLAWQTCPAVYCKLFRNFNKTLRSSALACVQIDT